MPRFYGNKCDSRYLVLISIVMLAGALTSIGLSVKRRDPR